MRRESLMAAAEINEKWIGCLNEHASIPLAQCPTNEEIAEVIEKYFTTEA
jgi:hypothetical protein